MSRYDALADYLLRRQGADWKASFAEIEKIIGGKLPNSARRYPAWWANQTGGGHSQTHAWMDVGWRTRNLDLEGETVQFERKQATSAGSKVAGSPPVGWAAPHPVERQRLFEQARSYTGIESDEALVDEAMRALVQREAAQYLISIGGTMPDFEPGPRQRRVFGVEEG